MRQQGRWAAGSSKQQSICAGLGETNELQQEFSALISSLWGFLSSLEMNTEVWKPVQSRVKANEGEKKIFPFALVRAKAVNLK